jgi:hydrogenase maturation factor HypE
VNGTPIADLAEDMPVARPVSPGDVVVLTPGQGYGIAPATQAYDTQVAGIVSTTPRVRFGIGQKKAAPVAMVGVVKAKATAVNGAIKFGDLLTTSPVAGHLMRCEAAVHCVGAIVGKALEPLRTGEQSILVFLWRQ